jgi:hypothetical protein
LDGLEPVCLVDWQSRTLLSIFKTQMTAPGLVFGTPGWLFNQGNCPPDYKQFESNDNGPWAGAAALNFYASAHQGTGKCEPVIIAAPWDQAFLKEWDNMLDNLSQYLQNTSYLGAREYDAIATVRITGLNRTTDEFRIPAEILSTQHNAGCDTNSIQTWRDAGYRPSLLSSAWDELIQDILTHFGDKYVNVSIIPTNSGSQKNPQAGNGQFPFPPIDENGCVYLRGIPIWARSDFSGVCTISATTLVSDQNRELIALASRKVAGKLSVEFENLHFESGGQPAPAEPTVVSYTEPLGAIPAYQPNDYFAPFPTRPGGMSCTSLSNPQHCSTSDYLKLLESGVSPDAADPFLRSQFLAVFFPDVDGQECDSTIKHPQPGCGYPMEIAGAHADLIDPPMVTISFPVSSPTTYWYTNQPVVGQVTASSAIGQPIIREKPWSEEPRSKLRGINVMKSSERSKLRGIAPVASKDQGAILS